MKSNSLKLKIYSSALPFTIMMVILVSNRIQYGNTYIQKAIGMGSILLWLVSCVLENNKVLKSLLLSPIALLLYISLVVRFFMMALSEYGALNGTEYIAGRIAMYVPMLAFSYYLNVADNKRIKKQAFISVLIWLCIVFLFLIDIDFDFSVSRNIVNGTRARGFYGATIDLAVGTGCIAITFLASRNNYLKSRFRYRLITAWMIFIFLLQGFITQSAIALIVGITGIIIELILPAWKRGSLYSIILVVIIIFIGILLSFSMQSIGIFFISNSGVFGDTIFKEKMIEIGTSLIYGAGVGDLDVRLRLYNRSLNTFFQYPIFGSVIRFGYNSSTNQLVGFHSGLDLFARFGLAGSLPLIIGLIKYYKKTSKVARVYNSPSLKVVILLYFLLGNWDHVEGFVSVCYILPVLSYVFSNED